MLKPPELHNGHAPGMVDQTHLARWDYQVSGNWEVVVRYIRGLISKEKPLNLMVSVDSECSYLDFAHALRIAHSLLNVSVISRRYAT